MLSPDEAKRIARDSLPEGTIKGYILYRDVYLFQIVRDDDFEEELDPFFSVNQTTGEFSDFSILTDGDTTEILNLFETSMKT